MEAERGEDFEHCYESGFTGQVGTVSLMLIDNDGGTALAASTADIVETPAGSGIYCAARTAPGTVGHYSLVWSLDGSFDADNVAIDDLFVVTTAAADTLPPLIPGTQDSGPVAGPCTAWAAVEDVANCCGVEVGSNFDLFEDSVAAASQILFEKSARQFKGICERTVRAGVDWPCGLQVLHRGHVVGWENTMLPTTRVLLPNYPVTEIIEVRIDGVALAESEYRLDGWQWLTRMADADGNRQTWPAWGRLDREATEEYTFEIIYGHGQNPPLIGQQAAAQLACEVYKSCPGNEGVEACKLPKNATRVTRQGITIEFNALYYDRVKKQWATGMNLVDLFLNTYNPNGLRRRPLIWSPDEPHFAVEVGTVAGS